ncbi:hypothetical protein B0H11DRAFT_1918358 [Mycena galericulata]|nr:hypothetical protein B0H11DRAFT_1918358 [Mycena galericulata]
MVSDYNQDVGDKEMKSPSMHQCKEPAVPSIPNYTSPERRKPQEGFFPTQDQDCPVAGFKKATYPQQTIHGIPNIKYPEKPNPQMPGRDLGTQEDSFESVGFESTFTFFNSPIGLEIERFGCLGAPRILDVKNGKLCRSCSREPQWTHAFSQGLVCKDQNSPEFLTPSDDQAAGGCQSAMGNARQRMDREQYDMLLGLTKDYLDPSQNIGNAELSEGMQDVFGPKYYENEQISMTSSHGATSMFFTVFSFDTSLTLEQPLLFLGGDSMDIGQPPAQLSNATLWDLA